MTRRSARHEPVDDLAAACRRVAEAAAVLAVHHPGLSSDAQLLAARLHAHLEARQSTTTGRTK